MMLTALVLYEKLKPFFPGIRFRGKGTAAVQAPMLWDGSGIVPGYAYILTPRELEQLSGDRSDIVAIVGGPIAVEPDFDVLWLPQPTAAAALLNRVMLIFQEFRRWDEALCACSGDKAGIRNMLNIGAEFLDGTLQMVDAYYNYVATSDNAVKYSSGLDPNDPTRPSQAVLQSLVDDPVIYQIVNVKGATVYHGIADGEVTTSLFVNLFREGESGFCYRVLLIREDFTYTAWHKFALEHLAARLHRISGSISSFDVFGEMYGNLKALLSRMLTEPEQNRMVINSALQAVSWSSEDHYEVWVFYPFLRGQSPGSNGYILSKLEQMFHSSCAILEQDRIVLLRNASRSVQKPESIRNQMSAFLKDNLYKVGISSPTENFLQIGAAYLQAQESYRLGSAKHPHFWYYKFEDYVLDHMILNTTRQIPAAMLCHKSFLTLAYYDRDNQTQYLETVRAWIGEKYNATHAAAKLYIHRTTFLDRMERIRALTNLDLDDWDTRIHLMLSYRMMEHMTETDR